jgi:hypothetical protein
MHSVTADVREASDATVAWIMPLTFVEAEPTGVRRQVFVSPDGVWIFPSYRSILFANFDPGTIKEFT